MKFKKISTIGLGYIGLPTAAVFASRKVEVVGVDVSENVVNTINSGNIHIVEPELEGVVSAAVAKGLLRASLIPEGADAFLIAVPTPFKSGNNGDDHQPDLSYIEAAAKSIAPVLKAGNLVVLESTSPVGTTEKLAEWLAVERPDLTFPHQKGETSDIRIAHCPERVLPGHVMRELVENDRVIGGMTPKCSAAAVALYQIFVEGECVVTNAKTAEMAKLVENSFRDVNIAFANELSMISETLDIDVWELIALANRHPRVNILQPGPGVGGHCIAVDPWFIISQAPEQARLIKVARTVNDDKPHWVIEQVISAVSRVESQAQGKTASDITVVCYGLAFKPDIDDLRESPALAIVNQLSTLHPGIIKVVEPYVKELPASLQGNATLVDSGDADGDVHLLLVDHRAFSGMPIPSGLLVDVRGFWRSSN